MVPFRFAGERSVLGPAKDRGVHPHPDTLGRQIVLSGKVRLNDDIVFQHLQT